MTRYLPESCPKCSVRLEKSPKGGRPTRWCSDGCKIAGEEEMRRTAATLRKFLDGLAVGKMNNWTETRREEVMAELQARYDHLAGVRPKGGAA